MFVSTAKYRALQDTLAKTRQEADERKASQIKTENERFALNNDIRGQRETIAQLTENNDALRRENELLAGQLRDARNNIQSVNKAMLNQREKLDIYHQTNIELAKKLAHIRDLYQRATRPINPETKKIMSWKAFAEKFGDFANTNETPPADE